MTPKAFTASRATYATGSVTASLMIGMTDFRYGRLPSTFCTKMDTEPKICADHFSLLLLLRLLRRAPFLQSVDHQSGVDQREEVWLPMLPTRSACATDWSAPTQR